MKMNSWLENFDSWQICVGSKQKTNIARIFFIIIIILYILYKAVYINMVFIICGFVYCARLEE